MRYHIQADPGTERQCPKCLSQNIHCAHFRSWEQALRLAFVRPYRCNDCKERFLGFRIRRAKRAAVYVLATVASVAITWLVIGYFAGGWR